MKKQTILLMLIAVLVSACSNEIEDISETGKLIIQGEADLDEKTRVIYNDEALTYGMNGNSYLFDGPVTIAFQNSEVVEFMFAQGTTYIKTLGSVTSVMSTGTTSRAKIVVDIPAGIDRSRPFDLYSVLAGKHGDSNHKGGYISSEDPQYVYQHVKLDGSYPDVAANRLNNWVQDREVADQIIQVASVKNIKYNSTQQNFVTLKYKHLGALIAVVLKNECGYAYPDSSGEVLDYFGFNRIRIYDKAGREWVYGPEARYNLLTEQWEGPTSTYADLFNINVSTRYIKRISYGYTYPTYRWVIPTSTAPTNLYISVSVGFVDPIVNLNQTFYSRIPSSFVPQVGKRYKMNRRWTYDNNNGFHISTNL